MNAYKTLNASRARTLICMSSPKIKVQGQSEDHVTSAFMLYF